MIFYLYSIFVAIFSKIHHGRTPNQLGAAANFDDLVKFDDRRQIRRSQMFIELAFEFRYEVIFMSHGEVTQSCRR